MTESMRVFRHTDGWREVTPQAFIARRDRVPAQYQWHITPLTAAEMRLGYECVLSEDLMAGFAISPEHEIVNVFALPDLPPVFGAPPGRGREAVQEAVLRGGTWVNYYDGFLHDFYRSLGFEESERFTFDDQYAPEGYDFEANGRPDVVVARYRP